MHKNMLKLLLTAQTARRVRVDRKVVIVDVLPTVDTDTVGARRYRVARCLNALLLDAVSVDNMRINVRRHACGFTRSFRIDDIFAITNARSK